MSIPVQAKRFRPDSKVSFLTEEGEITANSKHLDKQGAVIDSDVVSISTENDLNADAGTFKISLTNNNRWDQVLGANDLVKIMMWRNGYEGDAVVFIGLIDDVRKSTTIQGSTPQRVVNVIGRNFAKAFINFEVGVVQNSTEVVAVPNLGWLGGRITFVGLSSADIIDQVLKKLVYKYMNYKFSDGETLQDKIKLDLSSRPGEKLVNQLSFVNYQGNIQSFIKEIVDEPFNEVFWEVYQNEVTLVERETPFNKDNWNDLTLHEITDEDVVLDETGRSDIETYAFFSMGTKNYFGGQDIMKNYGIFPLWYERYFKKFGLRRLHRLTGYVGLAGSAKQSDVEKMKEYQKDLFNWNILNPNFFNGNLTVKGSNEFKIGDRVLYKSKADGRNIEFYIEGVSQEFVNFSHWNTRLAVTRGLPDRGADRFKSPWGDYEVYEAGDAFDFQGNPVNPNQSGSAYYPPYRFPGFKPSGTAAAVIQTAKSFIGQVTYRMGGGRSQASIRENVFDCSSFVRYVYDVNGIDIGEFGSTTTNTLAQEGVRVSSLSNLRPGDLIFFNTYKHNGHVGIYIGNGEFIGAQSSGCSIEDVNWWSDHYGLGSMRRVLI